MPDEVKQALELLQETKTETVKLKIEGKDYTATVYPLDAQGMADILMMMLSKEEGDPKKIAQTKIKKMLLADPETVARCIKLEPEYKGDFTAWLKREGVKYLRLATKVLKVSNWDEINACFFELTGLLAGSPADE